MLPERANGRARTTHGSPGFLDHDHDPRRRSAQDIVKASLVSPIERHVVVRAGLAVVGWIDERNVRGGRPDSVKEPLEVQAASARSAWSAWSARSAAHAPEDS